MKTKAEEFIAALENLKSIALCAMQAEESYRLAHAKALLASDGKNEAARKADADQATTKDRLLRNETAIERDVALHMVEFLKASAGGAA